MESVTEKVFNSFQLVMMMIPCELGRIHYNAEAK